MKAELKNILEVFRGEIKTILAVVLGFFSVLLWASLLVQNCHVNRRLAGIGARVDTLMVLNRNIETRISEMETSGFTGRGEARREVMGAGITVGSTEVGAVDSGAYCASKNSGVFHYPWCEQAQKISPRNLNWFRTRQDAIKTGRRPCRVCNP